MKSSIDGTVWFESGLIKSVHNSLRSNLKRIGYELISVKTNQDFLLISESLLYREL
jgi:hypothetical protein